MPEDPSKASNTARVVFYTSILTGGILSSFYVYRCYFRRFTCTSEVPKNVYRGRTLFGRVTSVGDGDNFHFYHTPGGRLAGWGWLRPYPETNKRGLGKETLHIRLYGVDAPERPHFGREGQPYGDEALAWLRSYILGRNVRVKLFSPDQYGRIVGGAKVWKLTGRKDVSAEMLKHGWGVKYEGKMGAEFNGKGKLFQKLEDQARKKRIGMFQQKGKIKTPGQYKKEGE